MYTCLNVTETLDIAFVSSKDFLDIQATIECRFTNDSLNIVVILAPGPVVFSAKCVQFLLTFMEWN